MIIYNFGLGIVELKDGFSFGTSLNQIICAVLTQTNAMPPTFSCKDKIAGGRCSVGFYNRFKHCSDNGVSVNRLRSDKAGDRIRIGEDGIAFVALLTGDTGQQLCIAVQHLQSAPGEGGQHLRSGQIYGSASGEGGNAENVMIFGGDIVSNVVFSRFGWDCNETRDAVGYGNTLYFVISVSQGTASDGEIGRVDTQGELNFFGGIEGFCVAVYIGTRRDLM